MLELDRNVVDSRNRNRSEREGKTMEKIYTNKRANGTRKLYNAEKQGENIDKEI